MNNVHVISVETLRDRLKKTLEGEALLYQRFEQALVNKDEDALASAMQTLRLYPDDLRHQVEETMLSWLFDQDQPLKGVVAAREGHRLQ